MENWLIALAIYFGLREAAVVIGKSIALLPIAYANTLSKEVQAEVKKAWDALANDEEDDEEETDETKTG